MKTAREFLEAGIGHMQDRASTYDKPQGERSMGMTVALMNILVGDKLKRPLSEEDGWNFMELLKMVRSKQGEFKADNYEDRAAYAGLAGEAASRDRIAPEYMTYDDFKQEVEEAASQEHSTDTTERRPMTPGVIELLDALQGVTPEQPPMNTDQSELPEPPMGMVLDESQPSQWGTGTKVMRVAQPTVEFPANRWFLVERRGPNRVVVWDRRGTAHTYTNANAYELFRRVKARSALK